MSHLVLTALARFIWHAGGSPWAFYAVALAGAVAIYCMLPSPGGRARLPRLAWLLGAAALAGLFVWMAALRWHRNFLPAGFSADPDDAPAWQALFLALIPSERAVFFYLFSAIALVSAARSMTHARPIYSVLYFVMTVLAVGAVLLLLAAEFLAVALILIYAGAILVLYVFVILLAQQADADPPSSFSLPSGGGAAPGRGVAAGAGDGPAHEDLGHVVDCDHRTRSPIMALLLSLLLVCGLGGLIGNPGNWPGPMLELALRQEMPPPAGTAANLGVELFRRHLLALELAGVLLLMAVVAAVALVRRRVSAR